MTSLAHLAAREMLCFVGVTEPPETVGSGVSLNAALRNVTEARV